MENCFYSLQKKNGYNTKLFYVLKHYYELYCYLMCDLVSWGENITVCLILEKRIFSSLGYVRLVKTYTYSLALVFGMLVRT